jgi:pyruvate dehydrogenase E2 component (dihydrolipoamide acetyltransferase)
MEEGTLAKWLVKAGDKVSAGDLLAEIETDKATMEFEAVDEGTIASIEIDEGTEGVAVGTVIAMLAGEGESVEDAASAAPDDTDKAEKPAAKKGDGEAKAEPAKAKPRESAEPQKAPAKAKPAPRKDGDRIFASPLARRIAE